MHQVWPCLIMRFCKQASCCVFLGNVWRLEISPNRNSHRRTVGSKMSKGKDVLLHSHTWLGAWVWGAWFTSRLCLPLVSSIEKNTQKNGGEKNSVPCKEEMRSSEGTCSGEDEKRKWHEDTAERKNWAQKRTTFCNELWKRSSAVPSVGFISHWRPCVLLFVCTWAVITPFCQSWETKT